MAALIALIGLGGGFIPATTILFVATSAAFGRRAILTDLAIGFVLSLIVFLIFDVEAIFLLPFAVAFSGLTVGASIAMLIFLLLLVEGLVWTWRKGILAWV